MVVVHGRLPMEAIRVAMSPCRTAVLVSTDIWGRGIDIERVNIVGTRGRRTLSRCLTPGIVVPFAAVAHALDLIAKHASGS